MKMKVHSLSVRDFRGFRNLDLDFAPDVTALVGVNGAGKTSVLDALALMFSCLVEGIRSGSADKVTLSQTDVRIEQAGRVSPSTARVMMTAEINGHLVRWNLATTLAGHPAEDPGDLSELRASIDTAQIAIASGVPVLPLVVYFPTNRNVLDIPSRIRTPHEFNSLSAYDGALEGGASNFRGFFEWFREEEDIFREERDLAAERQQSIPGLEPPPPPASPLPAVRGAIEQLVPGAKRVRIERRPQRMTVEQRNGVRLDVAQLSDGEKCLLALAGDLARRMALVAPLAKSPLEHPAIVLIDEVELHLHPGLQRDVLPRLRKVFPNVQLIISTHSPQVLSSLHAANVRVLDGFEVRMLDRGTWKRDTNRILETAFGDPGRPPEVASKLNELRDAVDADQVEEARRLIAELSTMIEGEDPDVYFYEQLLPPEASSKGGS